MTSHLHSLLFLFLAAYIGYSALLETADQAYQRSLCPPLALREGDARDCLIYEIAAKGRNQHLISWMISSIIISIRHLILISLHTTFFFFALLLRQHYYLFLCCPFFYITIIDIHSYLPCSWSHTQRCFLLLLITIKFHLISSTTNKHVLYLFNLSLLLSYSYSYPCPCPYLSVCVPVPVHVSVPVHVCVCVCVLMNRERGKESWGRSVIKVSNNIIIQSR